MRVGIGIWTWRGAVARFCEVINGRENILVTVRLLSPVMMPLMRHFGHLLGTRMEIGAIWQQNLDERNLDFDLKVGAVLSRGFVKSSMVVRTF